MEDIDKYRDNSEYIDFMRAYYRKIQQLPRYGENVSIKIEFANILKDEGKYHEALKKYEEIREELTSMQNPDLLEICEIEICMLHLLLKLREDKKAKTLRNIIQSRLNSFPESFEFWDRDSVDRDSYRANRMYICMLCFKDLNSLTTIKMECVLGRMYNILDNYKHSSQAYWKAYQCCLSALHPWHPLTLESCLGSALQMRYLCHCKEAISILRDLLDFRSKTLNTGRTDFQINEQTRIEYFKRTQYEIGNILYESGNYTEALKCYQRIREHSNLDEELTLNAKRMIENIDFKIIGDGEKALQNLEDICTIQEREHPESRGALTTLRYIAKIQQELGEYDEAKKTYQRMCKKMTSLNFQERDLIDIEIKIAMILAYECPEQAVKEFWRLHAKCNRIRKCGHLLHCSLKNLQATICYERNNYSAAIRIFKEIINDKELCLSQYHSDTLNIKHSLGRCYFAEGNFQEALSTYEQVRDLRYALYMKHHKDCLSIEFDIAEVHEAEDRLDEAFQILCDLYETATNIYTAGHREILKIESKMRSVATLQEPSNLIMATEKGEMASVMRCIRDEGKNVNTRSKTGFVPLHIACQKSYVDIFRYLLSEGANYEMKNWEFETPFDVANDCLIKHELEEVKRLFQTVEKNKHGDIGFKKAFNNARDNNGSTLLYVASNKSQVNIVKLLLDNDADIQAVEKTGNIALHAAAIGGTCEILKVLLDHLKNKNSEDLGEIINHKNIEGETPLHISVRTNFYQAVKLLLGYGADPTIKNKLGKSPLDLARYRLMRSFFGVGRN